MCIDRNIKEEWISLRINIFDIFSVRSSGCVNSYSSFKYDGFNPSNYKLANDNASRIF